MRIRILLCVAAIVVLAPPGVRGGGVRETHPNLIGGELGGKGIIYSIGYERYLRNRVGLGAGMMGFGTSDGGLGLFPLYLSVIPVGDVHSMYLSAGATLASGFDNWNELHSLWLGTVTAGYQYQSVGGFFVRPTLNLIFTGDGFLILPGFASGGSF